MAESRSLMDRLFRRSAWVLGTRHASMERIEMRGHKVADDGCAIWIMGTLSTGSAVAGPEARVRSCNGKLGRATVASTVLAVALALASASPPQVAAQGQAPTQGQATAQGQARTPAQTRGVVPPGGLAPLQTEAGDIWAEIRAWHLERPRPGSASTATPPTRTRSGSPASPGRPAASARARTSGSSGSTEIRKPGGPGP